VVVAGVAGAHKHVVFTAVLDSVEELGEDLGTNSAGDLNIRTEGVKECFSLVEEECSLGSVVEQRLVSHSEGIDAHFPEFFIRSL
jgi:hypothetical protein